MVKIITTKHYKASSPFSNLLYQTISISIFSVLFCSTVNSQSFSVSLGDRIESADRIVEGEIIASHTYDTLGSTYSIYSVKVYSSIFPSASCKNSSTQHCLYIVCIGGILDSSAFIVSHGLRLQTGSKGLFLLNNNNIVPVPFNDLPSYLVPYAQYGFFKYSIDSLANLVAHDSHEGYYNSQLIDSVSHIKNINNLESFVRNDWQSIFRLTNFDLGDTTKFSVSSKCKWGNSFGFNDLQFDLAYDTITFGTFAVANSRLSLSLSTQLNQLEYQLLLLDLNSSTIRVVIDPNMITDYLWIDTTYVDILEITAVPVGPISINGTFSVQSMQQNALNEQLNFVSIENFIWTTDLAEYFNLIVPITSVSPRDVAAGVLKNSSETFAAQSYSGIITIEGSGFTDVNESDFKNQIPAFYRIDFKIDDNSPEWFSPTSDHYIKWDDDEIILMVPSAGYIAQGGPPYGVTDVPIFDLAPGIGKVRMILQGIPEPVFSNDEIQVHFVHWSVPFDAPGFANDFTKRIRAYAGDHFGEPENDGGEFIISENFKNLMPAGSVDALERALETWRCHTRINYEIVDQLDNHPNNFEGFIEFGEFNGVQVPLGQAANSLIVLDLFSCDDEETISQLGMVFSDQVNFSAEGNPEPDENDVETVSLHEFGHNLFLGHIFYDEDSVMNPKPVNENQLIRRELEPNDKSAGENQTIQSSHPLLCFNMSFDGMTPLSKCANSTFSMHNNSNIFINKIDNTVIVNSLEDRLNMIRLFDSSGREIIKNYDIDSISYEVNLENFPAAVYFLWVKLENGSARTFQLVKL